MHTWRYTDLTRYKLFELNTIVRVMTYFRNARIFMINSIVKGCYYFSIRLRTLKSFSNFLYIFFSPYTRGMPPFVRGQKSCYTTPLGEWLWHNSSCEFFELFFIHFFFYYFYTTRVRFYLCSACTSWRLRRWPRSRAQPLCSEINVVPLVVCSV